MEKVTESMIVEDVLEMDAGIVEIFVKNGLHCLGCPGSYNESLKEAAEGHGISLARLLRDLNEYLSGKE